MAKPSAAAELFAAAVEAHLAATQSDSYQPVWDAVERVIAEPIAAGIAAFREPAKTGAPLSMWATIELLLSYPVDAFALGSEHAESASPAERAVAVELLGRLVERDSDLAPAIINVAGALLTRGEADPHVL